MRELKDLNEASPKLVQQSFKAEEDLKSKLIEMDTKELTLSEKTRDATAKLNVQRLSVCPSFPLCMTYTSCSNLTIIITVRILGVSAEV